MRRTGALAAALGCVISLSGFALPTAEAATPSQGPTTLVAIRAAHHPDYDRVVFEFAGALPAERSVGYVPQVIQDPTGQPVPLVGDAFLRVRMSSAQGHDDAGNVTYGAVRRTLALPDVIQVANAGDFEGVLSFGIGLARREAVNLFTLTNPSRVVVDISTPFRTVDVRVFLFDLNRFEAATPPYTTAVTRPVIPPATARGALQRLFAGPTEPELNQRLRFVSSGATGFTGLSIVNSVARVQLTGSCASNGSTVTIADQIMPTLKQFPSVRWVKIYDPAGNTERPDGDVDSIPTCLEP